MLGVLEFVVGIDPAVDPDVAGRTSLGDREGFRHTDPRCRRQRPPNAIARPERSEHDDAGGHGDQTRNDEDEGGHGGMIAGGPSRAPKGPKEPTRGVGVDAIAAVSLRSAPPG